jgi:hypothetical protein
MSPKETVVIQHNGTAVTDSHSSLLTVLDEYFNNSNNKNNNNGSNNSI